MFEEQATVFVIRRNAHGYLQKDVASLVNITLPYGSGVKVLAANGNWVWVLAFGIKAWMQTHDLAMDSPPPTVSDELERSRRTTLRQSILERVKLSRGTSEKVEYGPRGGRFVRSKSGFRRYF